MKALLALAMLGPLAACAESLELEATARTAGSDTERTAWLLADGDRAAAERRYDDLAAIVRSLDMLGARPLGDGEDDPVAHWRTLAGGDLAPLRGRVLGPGYSRGQIAPADSVSLAQSFMSGQRARVALTSDIEQPVQMTVRRGDASVVCDDRSRPIACSWLPLATERYTIEIANHGKRRVRYYLSTN